MDIHIECHELQTSMKVVHVTVSVPYLIVLRHHGDVVITRALASDSKSLSNDTQIRSTDTSTQHDMVQIVLTIYQ